MIVSDGRLSDLCIHIFYLDKEGWNISIDPLVEKKFLPVEPQGFMSLFSRWCYFIKSTFFISY